MSDKAKFDECVDWFYANRDTLLSKYLGKYVVCADDKVIGAWNDFTLAAANAVDMGYQPGTFAVQKCVPEADEAIYFHTPRVDFARTGMMAA